MSVSFEYPYQLSLPFTSLNNQQFLLKANVQMKGEYYLIAHSRIWPVWVRLAGSEASSIVEFAVSLPLLIVLVVGIFDFGGAFNLKQELNNATREGARFGASQPTNDLCLDGCTAPASVDAIRFLVDSYLTAAGINDCGLSAYAPPSGGTNLAVRSRPPVLVRGA